MGEQNVVERSDDALRREFMRSLLEDVRVLEEMIDSGLFETGIRRIGAEQEMFIVDKAGQPAAVNMDLLEMIDDDRFTHELGRYNMEANLSPQVLGGDCLRRMEEETREAVGIARAAAKQRGCNIALTGILPTLRQADLTLESMTPSIRYAELNDALLKMRGSDFQLNIKGIDELEISHGNVMLEACNTSFQVHFQVEPSEFAVLYNMAQAVTGPLMAACVNSPLLLGKRLWRETRIAVFEHSIDTRSSALQERGQRPRVHFGNDWVKESVIEIFREDIARFRVILTTDRTESPRELVEQGIPPRFYALCLHNGTVYRWNRACYGITDGKAHLRIENRVIPCGPTVLDEMANAAFFYGMLSGLSHEIDDIRELMNFEDVRHNFFAAAREGLNAQMTWWDGRTLPVTDLIKDTLAPLARRGLAVVGIDAADIDRYIGVIEDRVTSGKTGASWMLSSLRNMSGQGSGYERSRQLVTSLVELQESEIPGHQWALAEYSSDENWRDSYRTVSRFMTTDLFTVRPDDLLDFAASLMEWEHVRHVPVEDDDGNLVGLVSHRSLLRVVARGYRDGGEAEPVRNVMMTDVVTVTPDTLTVEAIRMMRENQLGCLPVVRDRRLVGIITERDLIDVAGRLLERHLNE